CDALKRSPVVRSGIRALGARRLHGLSAYQALPAKPHTSTAATPKTTDSRDLYPSAHRSAHRSAHWLRTVGSGLGYRDRPDVPWRLRHGEETAKRRRRDGGEWPVGRSAVRVLNPRTARSARASARD